MHSEHLPSGGERARSRFRREQGEVVQVREGEPDPHPDTVDLPLATAMPRLLLEVLAGGIWSIAIAALRGVPGRRPLNSPQAAAATATWHEAKQEDHQRKGHGFATGYIRGASH